jgi:hypothetical protein
VPADGQPGVLASQDVMGDCRAPECKNGFVISGKDDADVPEAVPGDCSQVTCYGGSRIPTVDPSDAPPDDKCKQCSAEGAIVPIDISGGETSVGYTFQPPADVVDRINQGLGFFERFGIDAELKTFDLNGSLTTKQCCAPATGVGRETEGKVSGNLGGLDIAWRAWPPPGVPAIDVNIRKEALGVTFTIDAKFNGGLFFDLDVKVQGEVGYRSGGCSGNAAGCAFGTFGTTVTLGPRIGFSGAATLAYSCPFCEGLSVDVSVNVVAGEAKWPFSLTGISYHQPTCDNALIGGFFEAGPLDLAGRATFSGSWSPDGGAHTFDVSEEVTLFDCTYGSSGLDC